MAKIVLTNAAVVINSVDLSDHISSVTLERSWDEVETTAYGDSFRTRIGGLGDASLSLDFHNDYGDASVYHTIEALEGGTTTVVINPSGTTNDTTNPEWTFVALITDFPYLDGAVGDLNTFSVTWPVSGDITEALS